MKESHNEEKNKTAAKKYGEKDRTENNRKRRRIIKAAEILCIFFLMGFSGKKLLAYQKQDTEAKQEYSNLEIGIIPESYRASAGQRKGSAGEEKKGQNDSLREETIRDMLTVQTEAETIREKAEELSFLNPDYRAWLWIPAISVSYPVVFSEKEGYYLDHTFSGKENPAGCLFFEEDPQKTQGAAVILGHNMKNGSMFGSLKNLAQIDQDIEGDGIEAWIFTKDGCRQLEFCDCCVFSCEDDSFYRENDQSGRVILSTCAGKDRICAVCFSGKETALLQNGF